MKKILIALLGLQAFATQFAFAGAAPTADNKKIATDFFVMAFTDRKPQEAAMKYISDEKYIQHTPEGSDGRDAIKK